MIADKYLADVSAWIGRWIYIYLMKNSHTTTQQYLTYSWISAPPRNIRHIIYYRAGYNQHLVWVLETVDC